jgi:hypothetical protein
MRLAIRALRQILMERRALAQKEQQVLSQMLAAIPDLVPNGSRARQPTSKTNARRRLVCARCGRRFALPMHLGRHTAMSHKRRPAA